MTIPAQLRIFNVLLLGVITSELETMSSLLEMLFEKLVLEDVSLCVPPCSSYNLSLISRRSVQLDNKHIAFGQARHLSRDETDFLGANEGFDQIMYS